MTAFADNPAPKFRLQDVEGKAFNLESHLGKDVVILDFWATFCIPCLTELETYRHMQLQYKAQGLVVAAVSVDQPQTVARVSSFARTRAFPFSVVLDPEQQVYRLYNVAVLPTTVLIDRQGRIVYRKEGFEPGDEKELDRRLSELMPVVAASPFTPNGGGGNAATTGNPVLTNPVPTTGGLLNNLSLSGSNFMRANYGKESRDLPDPNGWLEDWFDFRLANDKLSYQARFRDYEFLRALPDSRENQIRNPTDRVIKQTFAYESDHEDIRAGNFYNTINRGLILRTFEDRQARIDKDVLGVWASLNGNLLPATGKGRISVFGGKTFSNYTDLYTLDANEETARDTYLEGLEGEWQPQTGLKLGAQYVEAFRQNWHGRLVGGNAEWLSGPTTLYLGYAGLIAQDNINYPNDYHGRALYGALSENLGRLELGAEYKYYYNYDLGFTEPPSLVQFNTFRLVARDILFPNNQREQGVQAHGTWQFNDGNFYSANLSRIISHPERNPALLIHHVDLPYFDFDQQLQLVGPDHHNILLDINVNQQRRFKEGNFEDIRALSLGATGSRPLNDLWSLQTEAEVQKRTTDYRALIPGDPVSGKLGDVGAIVNKDAPWQGVLSGTLGRNSLWTFTLDYEVTTSTVLADTNSIHYRLPKITNGWASAYFTLSALEGNQISLWFGQRQERVVCSGGSCRLEPAFEGVELIWITHF